MKQGYKDICLHNFLDQKLRLVGQNIGGKFAYREMVKYFSERGEQVAIGEYWGKLVRGACFAYRYYKDEHLKAVLLQTAEEMLAVEDKNGDLSPVAPERQPQGRNGSDIWERKYVIWGFLELYRTFADPRFLECAKREVLYLASQVGHAPKTPITETGWAFYGIESSSVLDPVMQVYHLTGNQAVLDFARYIVESGCCKRAHLFHDILNGVNPKDIGSNGNPEESIAKAYEMMSCMEGLLRYYEATKEEKWLRCAIIFMDKVIEQEITEIGSGGADKPYNLGKGIGEQWNFTAYEQANPHITKMMETCVAVYFMKLCHTLYQSTLDLRYIEQIERSFYNALLGACSPQNDYFDYFMQFNGRRNGEPNFAHEIGGMPISCCSANGLTGIEMYPDFCKFVKGDGVYINLFSPCEMDFPTQNGRFAAECDTEYPRKGRFSLKMKADFDGTLHLRIPAFAQNIALSINGTPSEPKAGQYATFTHLKAGDEITLTFTIPLLCKPVVGGEGKVVFTYGNLLLARDKRFDPRFDQPIENAETYRHLPLEGDELVRFAIGTATMIDYQSAGKTWDETSAFYSIHTPLTPCTYHSLMPLTEESL